MDGTGCNIRVDSKGNRVMRIIPRENYSVNEEWISDKSRFVWDGIRVQRLDTPFMRTEGSFVAISWDEALSLASEKMRSGKTTFVAGDLMNIEALYAASKLCEFLEGSKMLGDFDSSCNLRDRSYYVGNGKIEDIDNVKTLFYLVLTLEKKLPLLMPEFGKLG